MTRLAALCNLDGTGGDELVVDFGPGLGLFVYYNDSSSPIRRTTVSPILLATGDLDDRIFSEP